MQEEGEPTGAVATRGCCARLKSMLRLTEEGATPVQWPAVALSIFTLFGSCYSITFLFPFLPEMILWFGYSEEEKGYYAGIVASMMFAGRAVGSYFWGWLSDRIGRRPVVLLCLAGVTATNLAFGFSTGVVFASITRFLNGVVNGLVGVCKTVLYETSDNTNQAVGMSFIGFAWGTGVISGPLVSGYLADPARRYPSVFPPGGFFSRFPYFLPSFIAAVVTTFVLFIDLCAFPETLESKKKKKPSCLDTKTETAETSERGSVLGSRDVLSQSARRVDVSASLASLDIQTASPMCHLSRAPNSNALLRRALSNMSTVRGLPPPGEMHKAQSIEHMGYRLHPPEGLDNYPLHSHRTSLSMHHIPSSVLLQKMGEENPNTVQEKAKGDTAGEERDVRRQSPANGDVTDAKNEAPTDADEGNSKNHVSVITEHNKVQDVTEGDVSNTHSAGEKRATDAYLTNHNASQDSPAETAVMLAGTTGNDVTSTGSPGTTQQKNGVCGASEEEVKILIPASQTANQETDHKEETGSDERKHRTGCLHKFKKFGFFKLFRISDVRYSVMLYTLYSFSVIGFEEIFTVWASTDVKLGGLEFSSEKIGAVIGFPSIPLMFLQVFVYPQINRRIGTIRTFQVFCVYLICVTPLFPTLSALHDQPTALWALLVVMQMINKISFTSCFTASSLLINNSIDPALAGTVNGLAMTFSAVARTMGPSVGGTIYSWSLSHGRHIGFPFDVHLVFLVFALVFLASNILSVRIPKRLEKQKKPQAPEL